MLRHAPFPSATVYRSLQLTAEVATYNHTFWFSRCLQEFSELRDCVFGLGRHCPPLVRYVYHNIEDVTLRLGL